MNTDTKRQIETALWAFSGSDLGRCALCILHPFFARPAECGAYSSGVFSSFCLMRHSGPTQVGKRRRMLS
jgi:hypothetical protein